MSWGILRKMLEILENTITLKDKTNKQLEFSLADAEIRKNEFINKYKELVIEKMLVNGAENSTAKPGDKVTFEVPFRVRLSDKLYLKL
jgi:hypothetical protein